MVVRSTEVLLFHEYSCDEYYEIFIKNCELSMVVRYTEVLLFHEEYYEIFTSKIAN